MDIIDNNNNFLAIDPEYSNLENSKIVILPIPYEHTVSFGHGTEKAPEQIVRASAYVEFYDDEFDRELCFDKGIATIMPMNFAWLRDREAIDQIKSEVEKLLNMDKFVVTVGGEHTISTAPILAHLEKYPDMSILHFDAHSDLRDTYEGNKYSHACFMARVTEHFPHERVVQVGIRAQNKEESRIIREKGVNTFYASAIRKGDHGFNWQKKVAESLGDKIYITFDVDYFDPSIMPATGTPEPDGFLYSETIDVFREIIEQGKEIVGFDVVELAPMDGLSHPNLTVARLIYKMLNFAFYNK